MYAYDGASAFSLAEAKAHGAGLITGYIVGHPGGENPIDKTRVQEILALGMGFLPNWERGPDYLVTCGYTAGKAAGQEAVVALQALDITEGTAVAFSWDTDLSASQYKQCGAVADGIIAGLARHYRFSAYGQGGLLEYFRTTKRMTVKGWLSGSTAYPGFSVSLPSVGMVQSHDASGAAISTPVAGTDINTVLDPYNIGALWPAKSPYGGNMALDPNDPVIVALNARLNDVMARIQAVGQVEIWGDATHPDSIHSVGQNLAALTPVVAALTAEVAALKAGGGLVDPKALALALAAHVQLTAV